MAKEYLKSSYRWQLRVMAGINTTLFWLCIVSKTDISTVAAFLSSFSPKDGFIGIVSPIICFVLDGLLSAEMKARIIYWRWQNPLPGSFAFSYHLPREHRADPDRLARTWGKFPADPVQQNRLWYKIYNSVDSDIRVQEAHRVSLYSRDLTGFAGLFLVIFGFSTIIIDARSSISYLFILFLIIQYFVMMSAARRYGVRFVRTALSVASLREKSPVGSSSQPS
ncbi:MAG: hypothetical protein F4Z87_01725 [Gammaproteobacteria bacterium]|nr:hypothetical protein [Gammaproteobacteria bacterium]